MNSLQLVFLPHKVVQQWMFCCQSFHLSKFQTQVVTAWNPSYLKFGFRRLSSLSVSASKVNEPALCSSPSLGHSTRPHFSILHQIKGLYRGATSSFVGMAFESSLLFGIYSQTKQSLQGAVQSGEPQPQVIIPSTAYSGAIISFVLCPTELVKVK